MDYLGWELERQRSALAALLLGGREAWDRDPLRDEARRSGAGMPELYAGSPEAPPGAWEAVRATRRDRENGVSGIPETPLSAWEAVLGRETGIPASSEEDAWIRLSGGTGAQVKLPRPSVGYEARQTIRRARADLTAEVPNLSAGGGEDGVGNRADSSGPGSGRSRAAGYSGHLCGIRLGGGRAAETPGRDAPAAAGTAPWAGWGAAAPRAEDSAKTLSRAVQRDARRYDGGFNIF